jgi:hypothetical protein
MANSLVGFGNSTFNREKNSGGGSSGGFANDGFANSGFGNTAIKQRFKRLMIPF